MARKAGKLQHLKATCRTLVRGPMFLSALSFCLLLAAIPAHGTLLHGYVNANQKQEDISVGEKNRTAMSSDEIEAAATVQPTNLPATRENSVQQTAAKPYPGIFDTIAQAKPLTTNAGRQRLLKQVLTAAASAPGSFPSSFPKSFAGSWQCLTIVIDSAVKSVVPGERISSQVAFIAKTDGRIVAEWEQPGWTETRSAIITINEREAATDRINYYLKQETGTWSTHSEDHYVQVDANRMTATSFVDQYIDGQYLGRYRTQSTLYRTTGNVALHSD